MTKFDSRSILISNINWELLSRQKQFLLALPECDEVDGLINLIDFIQDEAVDSGLFSEFEVFGEEELLYDEE